MEFLSRAMEAVRKEEQEAPKKPEYPMEVYVRRAMEFIHYNYATISVADVIRYIGFNRSYFTTVFKKQTGVSLQAYLLQVRMQEAKTLLLSTSLPIQEIALQVGYENASTFSLRFKSFYGENPKEYREKKWGK